MSSRRSGDHRVLKNVIAGLAGGLIASYVMEEFQYAVQQLGKRSSSENANQNGDAEPATSKAADALSEAATGEPLPDERKALGGELVHYAFGGAVGAMYGAAAAGREEITAWAGLPFGATLWLVADEVGVPLVGLSRKPTAYPLKTHASALAAHLVYGLTTETVRKLLTLAARTR
jgi:putative membrane protein